MMLLAWVHLWKSSDVYVLSSQQVSGGSGRGVYQVEKAVVVV